ncbi:MAG: proprotein convertase P-domain-containing protein [Saprospiraceae bacterium]|nr:proprotein convertase P-domain-containing protein [Saprospiraceae bacterium]MCF8252417.1 proprotein convertase P-domain-containing protein [Saprospiraceae bacterium]MCF8280709.1 proprotein convertase P-domain-containing protein [Bacteroidales bacterium]MCF8314015.1 proprotein convertase P-domain-containing protein [Saprospiraceae bacterium]MCF8442747.1 proprotein convertase P-domain-containing protein [Saprospiraceae bacterium]
MKKIFSTLVLASLAICLFAQTKQNPWLDTPESSFAKKNSERRIVPTKYRTLSLSLDLLKANLSEAPMRFSPEGANSPVKLAIPMPDGSTEEFQIVDAPIMHPDLAARYPYIRSFAGWSNADRTAYLRCGYTQNGFHGMILSANHSTVYIDAFAEGDDLHYISYFKKDYPNPHTDFECLVEDVSPNPQSAIANPQSLVVGDCQHRNYALALACTGEYATFHGGTKPLVLAQFNVAMTRVNGIYEKDLAVTMTMVANTDLLIYLNAGSDPYTNNSGSTMLNENQATCNAVIGNGNYDIGHVFSTGGGGIAQLNAVCNNTGKARGVTGLGSPVGDGFYVDYVCHEMGHQFGGNHTQNNDCNRNSATAMEVGSGSTIMGYAGVCAPNVQNHSDDYFHAVSLGEITNHLLGSGNTCATTTASGNNAPNVTVTQNSYTVPVSTPFVLTAQGNDSDPADVLTYCWEQMNNQVGTQPPLATNTVGPVFRTFNPTTSEKRYFPNLAAILAGTTPTWEVLPSVARSMAFRCTVRDNHPIAGCTDEVNVTLNFSAAAGPFVVTNPNTSAITWTGGSTAIVTWNVANTTAPPVAASEVEILLSADGGNTYPYTLLASTNNDGTEMVLVPNIATTQARVMVKALGNVFFDISNQNFKIELAVVPSFTLITTPTSAAACQSGTADFSFEMLQLAGFNTPVNFTATGVPAGATATFTPNNVPPPTTVDLVIDNLTGVTPGTYPITVTATGGSVTQTSNLTLMVLDQVTTGTTLSTPTDGAEVTDFQPTLTWAAVANAAEYLVEVSELPDFNSLFASGTAATNSFQVPTPCASLGVYYWRVQAQNPCSQSDFSQTFAFHLGTIGCQTFTATGLPLTIPLVATSVTKTLNVPANLSINSVQANMNIAHTYVGDLDVELTSPQGTTLQIFDRPGVPASSFGCTGDNIVANFADSFANSAMVFENTCLGTTPTISGNYQPIDPFAGFSSENSMGNWILKITDSYDDDGGALNNWSLDICGLVPSPLAVLLKNEVLTVPQGQSAVVSQTYLQGQGSPNSQVVFTLLSVPVNGNLIIGVDVPVVGTTFTQADIDAGLLSYQHDGSMTTSDEFEFDMVDNAGSWLHAQVFHINIIQNTLAATIAITQGINCFGENDGEITVTASGGNDPLTYSLNGGTFQSSNVFSGLAPGDYAVEVMDADGFTTTTASLTIDGAPAILASASVNNDEITVTASGGTGGLEYSIGGTFQSSNIFSGVANGTYTVTVMDANGCTATTTAIVAVNTLIVSASVSGTISCFGENDGEITVSVSGGSAPLQFSLNGGAFQSSNVFDDLAPGSYTVEVMDADGLTQTTTSVTISNPTQVTASASVNTNIITATGGGGTGTLEYSIGGAFQSSNVFSGVPNGTYTVTVMDENGCTATTTAIVFTNNIVVSGSVTQPVSCFGENDGEITATATGGNAPYTYSINGGTFQSSGVFMNLAAGSYTITTMDADGLTQTSSAIVVAAPPQITGTATATGYTVTVTASGGTGSLQYSLDGGMFQSSNMFTPVANGSHSITVRDANDCETTLSVTVTVPALTVSGSVSQPINCPGGTDGQITAVGAGGVPAYQYSLNGGTFQPGSAFSNLAAGTYTLTIKDSGGFTVSSSVIALAAPPALVVNPTAVGTTVTVAASGGTAPYQYQLDGGMLQGSNIFSGVANGTHTITVVDAHGCQKTSSIFIGGVPPNIFVSLSQPVSCHGESDAVITVNASGGTPPYTYSLNGGTFQPGNTFSGLAAGTYSLTVKGADGGLTTAPNIIINDPPALSVTATAFGLTITASGSGGSPNYQYSLDGTNFNTGNMLTASGNGSYTVTIRDQHGCTATTTVNVNAVVGVNVNVNDVSCFGESDGKITISDVTGGTAPYTYSLNGGAFSSQTTYWNLAPGDYTIRVKDATGYEFVAPSIFVDEPNVVQANFQLALNNLTIVASGGTGQLMYSIDGGLTFQTSNVFDNLPLNTYQVVVMDENGCTFTGQVVVDMSATNELFGGLVFEVLPNPSDGFFTLKLDLPTFANLDLTVFDVVGRRVFASQTEAVGAVQQPLDLRGLASGAYLLKVRVGELSGVKRLIILGQ